MKGFASYISWLFLPLFTPIYGLLVVLYLPVQSKSFVATESLYLLYPEAKFLFLLLFLVFIVLAPGLSFIVLKLNKTISSLQMENAEERLTPIAIMTFYCLVLYSFLHFQEDRKSTRLNSSHVRISYAVFCLKKKKIKTA